METQSDTVVAGKNISIIGAARSGVAVARLLKEHGANVFVSDAGTAERLTGQTKTLESLGVEFETGGHSVRVLDADLIVMSPGVPSTIPIIKEASKRNLRIVSELEVASWFCPCPIVAVTGTNGKTTTTTLIGRMLYDAKKPHVVAGNIGTAFSSAIDELTPDSIAVVEVSSFQLEHIERFQPKVSIILNITPDHLDRYEQSVERYIAAKCRIFERQTPQDVLIYNSDDPETCEHVRRLAEFHVHALPFSLSQKFKEGAFVDEETLVTIIGGKRSEIISTKNISIRGVHNLYNSMAAVLAAQCMGVGVPSIRATLKNFKGVEHRLEFVRELNGVRYVNDSKATNVDSVWYALQAFNEPLVLLLGGRDKGNDYSRLTDLVKKHVKAIVAIGESAETVHSFFQNIRPVVKAGTLEEAVAQARRFASNGDVVLLSPACASFDWFQNYEHRGQVFKQIVNSLQ